VLKEVDPGQILYGSDLPFTEPGDVLSKIRLQPEITERAKAQILGQNMARLLGIAQPVGASV
jgi:predicted TIM-barrel fold metal-dependent hydrolase